MRHLLSNNAIDRTPIADPKTNASHFIPTFTLGIMRRHEIRSASVKVGMKCEAFVFGSAIGVRSIALFESNVLQSAHGRAGRFESSTRRSPRLRQDSAVLFRLERTHALRPEFLGTRISQVPNQSPEPTTTAVTIPAAQELVPAAVVAHL